MKPIHIITTDETAAVICAELERMGQPASWGTTPGNAKYLVTPAAGNADALTADELLRCAHNLHDRGGGQVRTPALVMRIAGAPAAPPRPPQPLAAPSEPDAGSVAAPTGAAVFAIAVSVHEPYLQYLPDAIASVEAQTLAPDEKWLLCDSCEPPTLPAGWRVIRGDWNSVASGRDAALRQTAAEWITMLDADDALQPAHLATIAAAAAEAPAGVGMLYPDLDLYGADLATRTGQCRFPAWSQQTLRYGNFVPTPTTWRVQMLRDLGAWPAGVPQMDDWATAMRGSAVGWRGQHVEGTPVKVRRHGANVSNAPDCRQDAYWYARRLSIVTLFSGIAELLDQWRDWIAHADLPPQTTVIAGDNGGRTPGYSALLRQALAGLPNVSTFYIPVPGGMDMEPGVNGPHSRVPGLYNAIMGQACDLGDLVLMLEDDVLPPLNAVRLLAACFPTGTIAGPRLAGVAGVYQCRSGSGNLAISADPYNWRNGFTAADLLPGEQPAGQIPGGCSLFDSQALRSCLPFRWSVDSGGERVGWDGNACRHLQQAGWRLAYHGNVRCEHHVSWQRYSGDRAIRVLTLPPVDGAPQA